MSKEEAINIRTIFDDALVEYGQTILRRRPQYENSAGRVIPMNVRIYRGLDIETRPEHPAAQYIAGLDNQRVSDKMDVLYFAGKADIREDDELQFNGWVWTITLQKPFVISDIIVFQRCNFLRDRRP